jgi:hypothetical protein
MSTTTLAHDLSDTAGPERPSARLVAAELLKLRRRRGLLAFSLLLTVVPIVIGYSVTAFLHVHDPANHGPAGGVTNFAGGLDVLSVLGGIAATLVGATLGAGDLGAGVFRELVVTGRSRLALYTARIPAGLALLFCFVGAAFTIATTVSIALSGHAESPSLGLVAGSAGWIALTIAANFLVALGISSLVGSRSMAIGLLLGWQLGVTNALLAIGSLGVTREALLTDAINHFIPARLNLQVEVTMTADVAVIVVLAWTTVALACGAWRTVTRDV